MNMQIGKRIVFAMACALSVVIVTAAIAPSGIVATADAKTSANDIADTLAAPGMKPVTMLFAALKAADLIDVLHGQGSFTLFAPTNQAFQKLPPAVLDELLKPANKQKLRSILLHHLHRGDAITIAQMRTMNLSAQDGDSLMISVSDNAIDVNDAKLVRNDVVCSNGVIHWIDAVLMP
jgi:uncharacterized surface protein with fasciclin (FAS1) repeats